MKVDCDHIHAMQIGVELAKEASEFVENLQKSSWASTGEPRGSTLPGTAGSCTYLSPYRGRSGLGSRPRGDYFERTKDRRSPQPRRAAGGADRPCTGTSTSSCSIRWVYCPSWIPSASLRG